MQNIENEQKINEVKKDVILKYRMDENTVAIQNDKLTDFYFSKIKNILKSYSSYLSKDNESIDNIILSKWLLKLTNTFDLLNLKYYVNNNKLDFFHDFLKIDPTSSGFPHFKEIMSLKADLNAAKDKLKEFPEKDTIHNQMIQDILKYHEKPVYQQYLYTQKKYFEDLLNLKKELFLTNNCDLEEFFFEDKNKNTIILSWSNYESSINLPVIYLLEMEVSGKYDKEELEKELNYLTNSNLKLITIATKIDEKFEFLHPKKLKRIYIGPLYSNDFTEHNDLLQKIIEEAEGNRRFIFCFSEEELLSYKTVEISKGLFSSRKQEMFFVDKFNKETLDSGVSSIKRKMITPYEIYQRLVEEEHNYDLIKKSDKYIYSQNDEIIGY